MIGVPTFFNSVSECLWHLLGQHVCQRFHWLDLSRLESFRVALHAELLLDAGSGSNSISNASGQRRSALCERAMKLASPVPAPARSTPKPHHSKMRVL